MPAERKPKISAYGRAFRQVQMRPEADAKIRARLTNYQPRVRGVGVTRGWYWAIVTASLALAAFALHLRVRDAGAPANCAVETKGEKSWYRGACQLDFAALSVAMSADAALVQIEQRVELIEGRARFSVRKVEAGQPSVAIAVPGGRIEVLGTEFEVTLGDEEGAIMLYEGLIRFTSEGKPAVNMQPGDRIVWRWDVGDVAAASQSTASLDEAKEPAAVVPSVPKPPSGVPPALVPRPELPSVAPPKLSSDAGPARPADGPPRAESQPRPTLDSTDPVARILELKMRGEFARALQTLDRTVSAGVGAHTAEVLSFERGVLLEKIDEQRACEQFRRHQQRFSQGRYRRALTQRLGRCRPLPEGRTLGRPLFENDTPVSQ